MRKDNVVGTDEKVKRKKDISGQSDNQATDVSNQFGTEVAEIDILMRFK